MREVHLFADDSAESAIERKVVEELVRVDSQTARVYRTFFRHDGREIDLVTTSKDIHLFLGRMSLEGQDDFIHFLNKKLNESHDPSLIVSTDTKSFLVVRTGPGDGSTELHLQPAH